MTFVNYSLNYTYNWENVIIIISWEHANLLLILICTEVQIYTHAFVIWNK